MRLSIEQAEILNEVTTSGRNVLVDACVGSGKTTLLQAICNRAIGVSTLYLTYNKLLKIEAKEKISGTGRTVTNYHGFAYMLLMRAGIKSGQSDLIQTLLANQNRITIPNYSLILIDEYQDIDQEISEMLELIKAKNPRAQIIAVGDMSQKIYDMTSLNVKKFVKEYLGDYKLMTLTSCFRLSYNHAKQLGDTWKKKIVGVNEDFEVQQIGISEAIRIASDLNPKDMLCLGSRTGSSISFLNKLEHLYPDTFNKRTVYASIRTSDGNGLLQDASNVAIFTTFDSSKGLEKDVCFVFDFTNEYYTSRSDKAGVKYEILRNIFLVAMSRAKKKLYLVINNKDSFLEYKTLSTPFEVRRDLETQNISEMFDFKYKEDIEECFRELEYHLMPVEDKSIISVKDTDYNIDLMLCAGIFQELSFFDNFDYKTALEQYRSDRDSEWSIVDEILKLEEPDSIVKKSLYITAALTLHLRYVNQVIEEFISESQVQKLLQRLSEELKRDDKVQAPCKLEIKNLKAKGLCDVLKGDTIYELKFVKELTHEHFLQLACYMIAQDIDKGILWNTKDNTKYQVRIKDKKRFLKTVEKTIDKH